MLCLQFYESFYIFPQNKCPWWIHQRLHDPRERWIVPYLWKSRAFINQCHFHEVQMFPFTWEEIRELPRSRRFLKVYVFRGKRQSQGAVMGIILCANNSSVYKVNSKGKQRGLRQGFPCLKMEVGFWIVTTIFTKFSMPFQKGCLLVLSVFHT